MPAALIPVGRLIATWVAMLVLLTIIAASDYLPLGAYLPWVQFACVAGILCMLGFQWMNLNVGSVAVRIAAFVAIFFLFVLIYLSFNDYLTRRMDIAPFQALPSIAAPM